jgi:hypothetical protein
MCAPTRLANASHALPERMPGIVARRGEARPSVITVTHHAMKKPMRWMEPRRGFN